MSIIPAMPLALHAQTLDFGAAQRQAASNQSRTASIFATTLASEAGSMMPVGDAQAGRVRDVARARLRRVAADLLRSGDATDAFASRRALLGFTLASRMPELDALLASEQAGLTDPAVALLASDLQESDAWSEGDASVTLRDAIAPVLQTLAGPPSGSKSPSLAEDLARWESAARIPADAREAIARLDEALVQADAWVVYQSSARDVRARVRNIADSLSSAPDWVTPAQVQGWSDQLRDACRALGASAAPQPPEEISLAPMITLERLDMLATMIRDAATQPGSAAMTQARAALAEAVSTRPAEDREVEHVRRLRDAWRQIAREARLADDRDTAKPLRPVHRTLALIARQRQAAVLSASPAMLKNRDAMTDPAIVSALAAHRTAVDQLQRLRTVAMLIGPQGDKAPGGAAAADLPPPWNRLSSRFARVAVDLTKNDRFDATMTALQDWEDGAMAWHAMADPACLRPEDALGAGLLGSVQAPLAQAVSRLRSSLPASVAQDKSDRFNIQRPGLLIAADTLVECIESLRGVEVLVRTPEQSTEWLATLARDPGWEFPSTVAPTLMEGVAEAIQRAGTAIASGTPERATEALGEAQNVRRVTAPLRVLALLASRSSSPSNVGLTGPVSLLREIASISAKPLTDDQAQACAEWSRSMFEIGLLPAGASAGDRAQRLDDVRTRSLRVLDALARDDALDDMK